MSWQSVKLGQIFEIARGGSPRPIDDFITEEPDGLNWISIKDASNSGKYISKTKLKIRKEGLSKSRLVHPGDFLLTNSMSFGRPYIVNTTGCIHDGWLVLSGDKNKVNQDYFYHLLGSDLLHKKFSSLAAGAVVKNLNINLVKNVEVPLPPLTEQQKIAAILDAADSLRQKDQELVERYTALSQSLFLEMFGDPVTNPMGWSYTQLNNLVSKLGDGLHGTPEYSDDGEYFFINGNNLNHGAIEFFPETKKVSKAEFDKHKKNLNDSTILVSINGSIGKVAFYNGEKIILEKSACYFNTNEKLINKIYLFRLIESPYFLKYAMGGATGSTIKNVSLKTMRELPVPMPPINMQNQFAERAQLIEAQKQQAQRSLEKSEALFNSLLQRAFTGELTAKMAA
ncbi:restriction endonuclease subunit S [Methylophilus sp. DW102]|uniref:restriction endonuclease subunit S n=1 Tax=Methylophilus sp. DW102 TaxID=3095607 RepID=UPI0030882013|nr:restriction endonuclease subunit S [Methylophilus sp. DW102]